MVIVTQNSKTGVLVLYKNCKENVKQKILLTLFFQVNAKILTLFQHQIP